MIGNWFGQTWFNPALPLSSCVTLNLTVGTRAGHVAGSEAGGDCQGSFVPCPGPQPATRLSFTEWPLWAHSPTFRAALALDLSSGRAAPSPPCALSHDSSILLHPAPEAAASAGKCKQGPGLYLAPDVYRGLLGAGGWRLVSAQLPDGSKGWVRGHAAYGMGWTLVQTRGCPSVNEVKISRVHLFATPWTVARQAPLSMEFSRQEYWSG